MAQDGEVASLMQPLPGSRAHILGRRLYKVADAVIEAEKKVWNHGIASFTMA